MISEILTSIYIEWLNQTNILPENVPVSTLQASANAQVKLWSSVHIPCQPPSLPESSCSGSNEHTADESPNYIEILTITNYTPVDQGRSRARFHRYKLEFGSCYEVAKSASMEGRSGLN